MMRLLIALSLVVTLARPAVAQAVVDPAPIPDWARVTVNAAVTTYMVTTGIDYGQTMFLLGTGQFREVNPLLAWTEDKPIVMGALKLVTASAVSWRLLKMDNRDWKQKLVIALVLTGVNVYAIVHNYHAWQRYQAGRR